MLQLQLCATTDHVDAEVELLLHAAVAGGQVHMLLLPDSVWGDWAQLVYDLCRFYLILFLII